MQLGSCPPPSFFMRDLTKLVPFYTCSIEEDTASQSPRWRWHSSSRFCCSSAYRFMHHRGIIFEYRISLWKIKAPMKVQIFLWLLIDNKLLTQEVLCARGCVVDHGCALCDDDNLETRDHLMWECPFVVRFWRELMAQCNITMFLDENFVDVWQAGRHTMSSLRRVQWDTTWATGTWAIWKERNKRIFSEQSKLAHLLIDDAAMMDVHNWLLLS